MKLTRSQKKRLFSIIAGAACFAAGGICTLLHFSLAGSILFIAAGVAAGWMCVVQAVRGIAAGEFFDENTLMSVAAAGALAFGEFPECAAIMVLYQIGELFQSIAVGRSRNAIRELTRICPDTAERRQADGAYETVAASALVPGDVIRVIPGGRIPADCEILTGATSIDTSTVTGESVPRDAGVGDTVYSGCINRSGLIECRVLRPAKDSAAGRILQLTEEASSRKTKSEAFITRFAKVYTPAVTGIAAVIAFVVPLLLWVFLKTPYGVSFPVWGRRALSMLVISCPCALVISVPLGYFCALGNASKNGVLVKGSAYLDTLAAVDTAVFDKTGTLTMGDLTVSEVKSDLPEAELLSLAAAAEQHSTHPIAKAICAAATSTAEVAAVEETAGSGVVATLSDGRVVRVGRPETETEGTAVEVWIDGAPVGYIFLADALNPTAKKALAALRQGGVRETVILTGDNAAAARAVQQAVGADTVLSELLPEQKFERIEAMSADGKRILYVGDGINDAPSLARADVGVAIGALGSDAAIETADAVLMDSDLTRLSFGVRLSRKTVGIVRFNIAFSLATKIAVLALAALGLVGMWAAVLADVGVAILAVSNSMRLLGYKKQ